MSKIAVSFYRKKSDKIRILVSIIFMIPLIFISPTLANIKKIPAFEESTNNYEKLIELKTQITLDEDNTEIASVEIGEDFSFDNIDNDINITEESTRIVDPSKPMVALTFDDGPHQFITNNILDILDEYNSKATFFVVGNRIELHENELRRIIHDGHELGNHTYSHLDLTKNSQSVIEDEVFLVDNIIFDLLGFVPNLLRTPGGTINKNVENSFDKSIIMWNVDPKDWLERDASHVVSAVIDNVYDGDVVLLHDIYESTGAAVEEIVPLLIERGFQLVTISELAEHRGGLTINTQYRNFK